MFHQSNNILQIERGVHGVPGLSRIQSAGVAAAKSAEGEEQVGQGRPHRDVERWERRAVELRHGLLLQRTSGRGLTCVMIKLCTTLGKFGEFWAHIAFLGLA